MKRFAGAVDAAVRGRFAAAINVSITDAIDLRSFPRRAIERGMHVTVLRVGSGFVRLGLGEISNQRTRTTLGDATRFLVVAHERRHVVTVSTSASSTAAPT